MSCSVDVLADFVAPRLTILALSAAEMVAVNDFERIGSSVRDRPFPVVVKEAMVSVCSLLEADLLLS